jgi:fermentation-respiration switch protein FrsA (DUF1100 family)
VRTDVEFQSEGTSVKGMFLTPDEGKGPFPTIVMAGGWCYVKELVQPSYAEVINRSGIATLIIDYRRLGESGGEPRQHIDPWDQIEDYKNAISFAETLDEVDENRIGVWGISYSGGHVLIVGATDPRVKCVVSNIPVVQGWDNMRRVHGSLNFRRLQEMIAADRAARFRGESGGYVPMSSMTPNDEQTAWPFPEVYEVFKQLQETEAPNHEHRNTIQSIELLQNYSVFPFVERILDTPTMMIVAEGDDITSWDREIEAFDKVATQTKELVVLPHTSHMTLYSDKSRLEIAAEAAARWLAEHLAAGK